MVDAAPQVEPHDDVAEMAVLGSLILLGGDGDTFKDVTTSLEPEDFFFTGNKRIYEAILRLKIEKSAGRLAVIDLVAVKDSLLFTNQLEEAKGVDYLASLVETVPTAANAMAYAKIVRTKAGQRRIAFHANEIARKSLKGLELNGEPEKLAAAIKSISESLDPIEPSVPAASLEDLDLGTVDWFLEPLFGRGLMTFVLGKPKGGKSTFMKYCALSMSKGVWISDRFAIEKKHRGIYFHYEDGLRRVQERLLSYNRPMMLGPLNDDLRLFVRPPRFDLATGAGISTLRKLIERDKADFVVLDTLSKCHSADENSQSEMQPVMTALRDITLDYNIAMIVIHHVRKTGSQGDAGGVTDKVRGSGSIGAEADVILDWGNRVAPNLTYCQLQSKEKPGSDEWNVRYIEEGENVRWMCEPVTDREDAIEVQNKIASALESLSKSGTKEAQFTDVKPLVSGASDQTIRNYLKLMADRGKIVKRRADELPRKPWLYSLKRERVVIEEFIRPRDSD